MHRELPMQIAAFLSVLLITAPSLANPSASPTERVVVPGFAMRLAKLRPTPDTTKVRFDGNTYYLKNQAVVRAADVEKVTLGQNLGSGTWSILIKLNRAGGERMRAFTGKHLRETLCATVVDQIVQCASIRGVFGPLFELSFDTSSEAQTNYQLITGHADSAAAKPEP